MSFAPLTRLPAGALTILKEIGRLILRRPIVGIAAIATTGDGRTVLVRRGDLGTWALPGGTLEWGETLREALVREMAEECGINHVEIGAVTGVYSRPDRDPRFHGVTIVVRCNVAPPIRPPSNPLEILEVGLFEAGALPKQMAFGMEEMVADAARGGGAPVE